MNWHDLLENPLVIGLISLVVVQAFLFMTAAYSARTARLEKRAITLELEKSNQQTRDWAVSDRKDDLAAAVAEKLAASNAEAAAMLAKQTQDNHDALAKTMADAETARKQIADDQALAASQLLEAERKNALKLDDNTKHTILAADKADAAFQKSAAIDSKLEMLTLNAHRRAEVMAEEGHAKIAESDRITAQLTEEKSSE